MITRRKNTKTETPAQQGPRSRVLLGRPIQSIVSASSLSRTAAFLSLVFLPLVVLTLTFVKFQKQMTSLIPAAAAKKNTATTTTTHTEQRLIDLHDKLNTIIHSTALDEIRHANRKISLLVQPVARTSELNNDNDNTSTSVLLYTSSNNNDNSSSSSSSLSSSSAMTRALDCLCQTKPVPHDLPYPEDAYAHFQEIHQRLEPWTQQTDHKPHRAAGYHGPWIENHWITHFQHTLLEHSSHNNNKNKKKNNNNTTTLSEIFGPYIPLFIPWTDIWVQNRHHYPKAFVHALLEKDFFRNDVLYITVNQNDAGFPGR